MTRPTSDWIARLPRGLEPDVVLPVQFYMYARRGTAWTGEQRLIAAMLEDALTVCSSPALPATAKRRQLQRETMRWLRSNDRAWMFSFLRVCEALDLDPGDVRRAVHLAFPSYGPPGVANPPVAPSRGPPDRPRRVERGRACG